MECLIMLNSQESSNTGKRTKLKTRHYLRNIPYSPRIGTNSDQRQWRRVASTCWWGPNIYTIHFMLYLYIKNLPYYSCFISFYMIHVSIPGQRYDILLPYRYSMWDYHLLASKQQIENHVCFSISMKCNDIILGTSDSWVDDKFK